MTAAMSAVVAAIVTPKVTVAMAMTVTVAVTVTVARTVTATMIVTMEGTGLIKLSVAVAVTNKQQKQSRADFLKTYYGISLKLSPTHVSRLASSSN